MTSVAKTARNLTFAVAGAVFAWLIVEPCPWLTSDAGAADAPSVVNMVSTVVLGMVVGMCVGFGLGASEGISSGSTQKFWRSLGLFTLLGALGGLCGIYFGQIVYGSMAGSASGAASILVGLIARTLGWGLWGIGVGVGVGLALGLLTGSSRRLVLSSIGGALGGAFGGFAFEIMGWMTRFTGGGGEILRLVGFAATAGGVAFFASLAQELFKQAWVKVLVGRGEGREYVVDKPETVVGRDELADIPLFGDTTIAKRHLIIRNRQGVFSAESGEPGASFAVNGQQVSSAPLTDGALITIGSRQLEFHTKRAGVPVGMHVPSSATIAPVVTDPGLCQFCGQRRDAPGGCECSSFDTSPVSAPAAASAPAAVSTMGQYVLEVISGPSAGLKAALAEGSTVEIGREPGVDLHINDTFASRRHARVSLGNGAVNISDQGSSNGTLVNGVKVTGSALVPGDIITIGQSQIRLT